LHRWCPSGASLSASLTIGSNRLPAQVDAVAADEGLTLTGN